MVARFSLYDFIAAVIPGLLFIWAVSFFSSAMNATINIPLSGNISETSILISLAYIIGLLLQGISQGITEKILLWHWGGFPSAKWLLEDDKHLSKEYKSQIKKLVENKYHISAKDNLPLAEQLKKNQEIFYLCYNAVEKAKISERPQIFNAHYGLFRCLLTSFSLLFIACVILLICGDLTNKEVVIYVEAFFLIGILVSYFRTKKRGQDFAKSIYDLFITHYSNEEASSGK
jgi:hypothetical protein